MYIVLANRKILKRGSDFSSLLDYGRNMSQLAYRNTVVTVMKVKSQTKVCYVNGNVVKRSFA